MIKNPIKITIISLFVLGIIFNGIFVYELVSEVVPEPTVEADSETRDKYIQFLPKEELNEEERDDLVYMIQEEQLAHDLYRAFYELYPGVTYLKIPDKEQQHVDAIHSILTKYDIEDPLTGVAGDYQDPILQSLYNKLYENGSRSEYDSYLVGAYLEEVDIIDVGTCTGRTDNEDILFVYSYLDWGSRNHLRKFYTKLLEFDHIYSPLFVSQEDLDAAVNRVHSPPAASDPFIPANDNWLIIGSTLILLSIIFYGFNSILKRQGSN
ncbi:MAG: DUF2202 domain-containing protein [Candidatus Heimdallarchaeota archaeon]|nr:DUF2202 domain-containing protein [Candidatus Heimdallarchaeota archaeon]